MTIPPAHRRLIPRAPKSDPPEDLEVTSRRIVINVDQTPDPELAETEGPDLPETEGPDYDDVTDDDHERPSAESLEMTAVRKILPDEPDASDFFQQMTAERIAKLDDPSGFNDLEPTALKTPKTDGEHRPTAHISPAERGLLAAMAEGHEPSRLKYMEWLERRGEASRAEFLRLDHALATLPPDDPRRLPAFLRLRELAQRISIDWRSRIARSQIEACNASQCPAYWRALPSESDDVRRCSVCMDDVYYCATVELARARIHNGQRVAIDITCERWPGDLEPRCPACQCVLAPRTRFCTQCGQPL
jgi:hypothetical protein